MNSSSSPTTATAHTSAAKKPHCSSRWKGKKGQPRFKPPFPASYGLYGKPTTINNTETFANIPQILAKGAEWYKSLGLGDAAGTKLYSLSGDVLNPGLYELPMGTTLQSLIFDHGGGMLEGRTFKAVFTGGPSNTLLTVKIWMCLWTSCPCANANPASARAR